MIRRFVSRVISSPTFKTLFVFAGANMIGSVLQGLAGLIQARWVTPEVLGEFRKYGILTTYSAVALVLVQDGLMRQFPYLIGKGEKDEAVALAGVAKGWYLGVFFCMGLFFLGMSSISLCQRNYVAAAGWAAQIVLVGQLSYGTFLQIIYRRSMEFKRLSYNGLISAFCGVVSLVFVKLFAYYGIVTRICIVDAIRIFFDNKYLPMKIKMVWDWVRFLKLVKISIPLSVIGYIRTSFLSATFGYLVLRYCGKADLGIYGIAVTFQQFAMLFTNSLTQIFNAKMTTKLGECDSIKKSVKPLILPTVLSVCAASFLAVSLCVIISPFIHIVLPQYLDAIPVIYVLSLGLPITAFALPAGLLRASLQYKIIYIIGIMKVLTVIMAATLVPKTIVWLAGAMMLGELIEVLLSYCFLYKLVHKEKEV